MNVFDGDGFVKRVLVSGLSSNFGGIERYIINTVSALSDCNIHFDLLYRGNIVPYENTLRNTNSSFVYVKSRRHHPFTYRRSLQETLATKHYDAVWSHVVSLSDMSVIVEAKKADIRTRVIHSHTNQQMGSVITKIASKLNESKLACATHYWACSKSAEEFLYSSLGASRNTEIMQNGVLYDDYKFDKKLRSQLRAEHNLEGKYVLGSAGRLTSVKNYQYIVNLMPRLVAVNPNIVYLILGEGPLQRALYETIEKLGLKNHVKLLGFTQNISNYYHAMDLFLVPSLIEGLGYVMIEAQASGLQVIASDNVPTEARISPNVKFLPLLEETWISAICNIIAEQRTDESRKCSYRLLDDTFDLKHVSKHVENELLRITS